MLIIRYYKNICLYATVYKVTIFTVLIFFSLNKGLRISHLQLSLLCNFPWEQSPEFLYSFMACSSTYIQMTVQGLATNTFFSWYNFLIY